MTCLHCTELLLYDKRCVPYDHISFLLFLVLKPPVCGPYAVGQKKSQSLATVAKQLHVAWPFQSFSPDCHKRFWEWLLRSLILFSTNQIKCFSPLLTKKQIKCKRGRIKIRRGTRDNSEIIFLLNENMLWALVRTISAKLFKWGETMFLLGKYKQKYSSSILLTPSYLALSCRIQILTTLWWTGWLEMSQH